MKRIIVLLVIVGALGELASSVRGQNIVGTWQGTVNFAWDGGYGSGTASLHVTNQLGGLFKGYFVPAGTGGADTNTVTGTLQPSVMAPGSFDITVSISMVDSPGGVATGLLSTNNPQKITRIVFPRPACQGNCPQNYDNFTAAGKLLKTSSTP